MPRSSPRSGPATPTAPPRRWRPTCAARWRTCSPRWKADRSDGGREPGRRGERGELAWDVGAHRSVEDCLDALALDVVEVAADLRTRAAARRGADEVGADEGPLEVGDLDEMPAVRLEVAAVVGEGRHGLLVGRPLGEVRHQALPADVQLEGRGGSRGVDDAFGAQR